MSFGPCGRVSLSPLGGSLVSSSSSGGEVLRKKPGERKLAARQFSEPSRPQRLETRPRLGWLPARFSSAGSSFSQAPARHPGLWVPARRSTGGRPLLRERSLRPRSPERSSVPFPFLPALPAPFSVTPALPVLPAPFRALLLFPCP